MTSIDVNISSGEIVDKDHMFLELKLEGIFAK